MEATEIIDLKNSLLTKNETPSLSYEDREILV